MSQARHVYDHIAGDYDRHRPEYPDALMLILREHIEAGSHPSPGTVVDAGSGTGISTRMLRRYLGAGYRIIGLEPGDGMRRQAVESTDPDLDITYVESTAEAMPFDEGTLAGVVVAQAVQWFDRPRFYQKALRVLRPHGTLAIMQNNRDWRESPFLEAYESFLEANNPDYNRDYRAFDITAELQANAGFGNVTSEVVIWDRPMTTGDFYGMARSSSRLQQAIQHIGEERAEAGVRELAGRFAGEDGMVSIRYRAELYLARRAE